MWVMRLLDAPRGLLRRFITLLVTSGIVASFAIIGPLAQQALAIDAAWEGSSIRYNTQLYTPESTTTPPTPLDASDPRDREGELAYTWIETLDDGEQRAHTIFVDPDAPRSEEISASLVVYDFSPPDDYSNPSSPTEIVIANDLTAVTDNETSSGECNVAGIGWFVCPTAKFLSEGVDWAYGVIREFLEVPAATTDTKTGLYAVWSIVRSVANVCFIIVLLVVIYSQLTSLGISNHGIKSILPRLIIGAVLVNVSFWLTALAVDLSNGLGHSVHAIFENVRTNLPLNIEVTWSALTVFILSGGAAIGTIAFVGSVAGSVIGMGFMLLSALVSVAFGVFVAFIILAARQALITILIIIAPLAFIAYILPSTRSLFDRWRKSFTTLLLFFPLFALLFGGSSLAGAVIMNNADDRLHIVLIGLAVQFIPLVITPLLIQFSTGLLGRIAGMAKSRPGFVGNAKNWARNEAGYQKDRALGQRRAFSPFKALARAGDRRQKRADERREGYKAQSGLNARQRNYNWRNKKFDEPRSRRSWEQASRIHQQASGDLSASNLHNEGLFKELQAGTNNYKAPVVDINRHVVTATNKVGQTVSGGRLPTMRTSVEKAEAEAMSDAESLARNLALEGTRKSMAERKHHEIHARELTDNVISIDGRTIQEYAAGIMGETGRNSIVASAKSTVSQADMKDAENIKSAIPRDIQTNNDALRQRFIDATTMTERLAYANQMADNGGHGFIALRNAIKEWESRGQGAQDLNDMKEYLGTNGKIMSGGKDLETWITNDGGRKRAFDVITDDVGTWKNLSASAFASMNNSSQDHALNLMRSQDTNMYNQYRRMLLDDPSSLAGVKREIRVDHGLLTSDDEPAAA